jgi:hypothetical protein
MIAAMSWPAPVTCVGQRSAEKRMPPGRSGNHVRIARGDGAGCEHPAELGVLALAEQIHAGPDGHPGATVEEAEHA